MVPGYNSHRITNFLGKKISVLFEVRWCQKGESILPGVRCAFEQNCKNYFSISTYGFCKSIFCGVVFHCQNGINLFRNYMIFKLGIFFVNRMGNKGKEQRREGEKTTEAVREDSHKISMFMLMLKNHASKICHSVTQLKYNLYRPEVWITMSILDLV